MGRGGGVQGRDVPGLVRAGDVQESGNAKPKSVATCLPCSFDTRTLLSTPLFKLFIHVKVSQVGVLARFRLSRSSCPDAEKEISQISQVLMSGISSSRRRGRDRRSARVWIHLNTVFLYIPIRMIIDINQSILICIQIEGKSICILRII